MPQIQFVGFASDDARIAEAQDAGYSVDNRPAGSLDTEDQRVLWGALRNAAPAIVWLRWDQLESPVDVQAVRRFHVLRPQVRIVVEIPADHPAPDAGLAALVGMGIFDVVSPGQLLAEILAKSPTYADVARWHSPDAADWTDGPEPEPVERIVERVVEKERIVVRPTSSRTTIIAVWGAVPGTGATTLALAIGRCLSQFGRVAILDHAWLSGIGGGPAEGESGLAVAGAAEPERSDLAIVVGGWENVGGWRGQPTPITPNPLEYARQRQWDYVVVDAGLASMDAPLFSTADLNLVIIPPVASRLIGTWHWLQDADDRYHVVVWGDLASTLAPQVVHSVTGLPWPHEAGHAAALETLLAPVMPSEPATVIRARRRRRWRRRIIMALTLGLGLALLVWFGRLVWIHH